MSSYRFWPRFLVFTEDTLIEIRLVESDKVPVYPTIMPKFLVNHIIGVVGRQVLNHLVGEQAKWLLFHLIEIDRFLQLNWCWCSTSSVFCGLTHVRYYLHDFYVLIIIFNFYSAAWTR